MAAPANDPFATFAFVVAIDGIATGFFQEVSGLSAQIDIQEVQEGGRNNTTRKLVGQGKFPNLVLKRGFANQTLLDALMKFHNTKDRLHGTITLRSAKGDDIASWEFKNGIPVKWDGPQLNVSQNAIAIESLEIAHEGLVNYKTATVSREGTVTSVTSGPPAQAAAAGPGASPYEENNVNSPVSMPPEPNAPSAPPSGNTTDAVNQAFNANGANTVNGANTAFDPAGAGMTTEAVNSTFDVNAAEPQLSDWQQWGNNDPVHNANQTWESGFTDNTVTNTAFAQGSRDLSGTALAGNASNGAPDMLTWTPNGVTEGTVTNTAHAMGSRDLSGTALEGNASTTEWGLDAGFQEGNASDFDWAAARADLNDGGDVFDID